VFARKAAGGAVELRQLEKKGVGLVAREWSSLVQRQARPISPPRERPGLEHE